jgi:hypothetical protein
MTIFSSRPTMLNVVKRDNNHCSQYPGIVHMQQRPLKD